MIPPASFRLDSGADDAYPAGLYAHADTDTGGIDGLASVSDADVTTFHERGYLVVRHAFTPEEVASALQGLSDLIAGKRPDFTSLQFENAVRDHIDELTPDERLDAIRKIMWFVDYDDRLRAMASHPSMLDVLRRIIGSDELTMFQDMGLVKPPRIGREKPWHQDMAYFDLPVDTVVAGVWIALDPVGPENGCMRMLPGSHHQGPHVHVRRRDWQICDTDVPRNAAVAVPMQPGDALLFHGLIHHGTPANRTDRRRRALQFHYRAASAEETSEADRLATYGSEGKNVEC
ncbi:MAG: hypothetical protein Rubg2KO_38770 [Rubricoccaceae bacterium]